MVNIGRTINQPVEKVIPRKDMVHYREGLADKLQNFA
jgi:hypothetical protein